MGGAAEREVEYLEIEVYRTTPLVPDGGLVGDNRASESFRVCNFLRRSVQSLRPLASLARLHRRSTSNREKSWRTVSPLFFYFSLQPPPRCPPFLQQLLPTSRFCSRWGPQSSFTSVLRAPVASKYKIYGRRYREICGRQGAALYSREAGPLSGGDCVLTSDRFMVIGIRAVLLHQDTRDGARRCPPGASAS